MGADRAGPRMTEQAQATQRVAEASERASGQGKTDLLLRLFTSEFFDEWIAVSYLWRSQSQGVHDYLCNRVWTLSDAGVERYLQQFCTLLVARRSEKLEHTVVGLCHRSLRIALKLCSFLRSLVNDSTAKFDLKCILQRCEDVARNARWKEPVVLSLPRQYEPWARLREDGIEDGYSSPPPESISPDRKDKTPVVPSPGGRPLARAAEVAEEEGDGEARWSKEECAAAYDRTKGVIDDLCNLGLELRTIQTREGRQRELQRNLAAVSEKLTEGPPVLFPLGSGQARMLRIPPDEALLLNSREKAPYFICVEVLGDAQDDHSSRPAGCEQDDGDHQWNGESSPPNRAHGAEESVREPKHGPVAVALNPKKEDKYEEGVGVSVTPLSVSAKRGVVHRRLPTEVAMEKLAEESGRRDSMAEPRDDRDVTSLSPANTNRASSHAKRRGGETWAERCERVRSESPFGCLNGWRLEPVIVKTGDDCRQELLAAQVTATFQAVFQEAGLPLWLRPYEVFVTGARTALMEAVPDAPSLHSVRSRSPKRSLLEHFRRKFGPSGTPGFQRAQRNFIESLAAYSLVAYMLQLKDRHNGNILLDEEGHVINIDFSFMLSNSPGGINFESAPFKLTREFLELMDSDPEGTPSDPFNYFKVLMIQGFLAARKHAERIVLLVEMLQPSNCPCFRAGPKSISQLRRRFRLNLTEEQCVEHVLSLISDSLDAWSTRQYDLYQRILTGIL